MLKKLFPFIICVSIFNITYAETCPAVHELKSEKFMQKGWEALGIDSGEPLDREELNEFKKNVGTFSKAVWLQDAPEGPAQCFYDGNDSEPHLGVYLAKQMLEADTKSGHWHVIDDFVMECNDGIFECRYKKSA